MKERRVKSLFGGLLKESLQHAQPKLRSEHLPEYRRFYVDNGVLKLLHNNDEHLIVGRRGTGKTHLLGAFNEMIRDEFPDEMSFMFSLSKLDNNSYIPNGSNNSNVHAYQLFYIFLRKIFPLFLDRADARLKYLSTRLSRRDHDLKSKQVNNLLTQLLETVELGSPVESEATSVKIIREDSGNNSDAGAGLSFNLDKNIPSISGSLSVSKKKNNNKNEQNIVERRSTFRVDYIKAGELISEVLEELEVRVLHILIDEWMELDKRTPSGIQPIFAQLLKKTFFNSNCISTKIASVWHQTSLYDRGEMSKSKGIELKHDIIKSIDLDSAFLTKEIDVFNFCKELLYKRLLFSCEEAGKDCNSILSMVNSGGVVDDIIIIELFDNWQNFKAYITSSHAIPRDLMNIFHLSSLKIRRNFEKYCIDHKTVFDVARNSYKTDKRKAILPNSNAQKLLRIINKYMEDNDRRLFLVENSQVPDSNALQKLVDEELIHQVPSSVTHRSICDSHKTYLVDFGNYVDWIETQKKDISSLLDESVLANFPDGFDSMISNYVIDISVIDSDYINCPACTKSFSISEPVYIEANLCVYCAYNFAKAS